MTGPESQGWKMHWSGIFQPCHLVCHIPRHAMSRSCIFSLALHWPCLTLTDLQSQWSRQGAVQPAYAAVGTGHSLPFNFNIWTNFQCDRPYPKIFCGHACLVACNVAPKCTSSTTRISQNNIGTRSHITSPVCQRESGTVPDFRGTFLSVGVVRRCTLPRRSRRRQRSFR